MRRNSMKMWIIREHRGDSFCLFLQEEKPVQGEDQYWYHKGGIRGLKIPRLLFPEKLFPNMKYDSPMEVELVIKNNSNEARAK